MSGFEEPCKNQLPDPRQLATTFSLTETVKGWQSIFTEVVCKLFLVTFVFKVSRAAPPDNFPNGKGGNLPSSTGSFELE